MHNKPESHVAPTANTVYLSPAQVAERLSFHDESIRRLVRARKLPSLKIGGRTRIALRDVEAFEQSHRR